MLWRYRFPTEQWGYELLGGLVEDGEDSADAAAREAVEESGWRPVGEPEKLISFEPLPGRLTAPVDVFLWRDAEHIGEPTDAEEVGRLAWMPVSRVLEIAARGELLGSGTLVPLIYYVASCGTARGSTHRVFSLRRMTWMKFRRSDVVLRFRGRRCSRRLLQREQRRTHGTVSGAGRNRAPQVASYIPMRERMAESAAVIVTACSWPVR